MNVKELFDLAPYGAAITYSDGTPKPPPRFKRKVQAWEGRNGSAMFTCADPGDPSVKYSPPHVTLTQDHGWIVVNQIMPLTDKRNFEITSQWPLAPGTIMAFNNCHGAPIEIQKVWPTLDDALLWARNKGATLARCGYDGYFIVNADGERELLDVAGIHHDVVKRFYAGGSS